MNRVTAFIKEQDVKVMNIFKNILIAYVLSLVLLLIFAVILTYTNIPESSITTVVLAVSIIGILYGSKLSASKAKSRGWLIGSVTGLLYMFILYLISLLANNRVIFDMHVLSVFIIGIVAGAVGGIIGINFKKNEKRHR